jgi:hypothetical protein
MRRATSNLYAVLAIFSAIRGLAASWAGLLRGGDGAWCVAGYTTADWRSMMLDVVMLALGGAFFVVAILYTIACDRI